MLGISIRSSKRVSRDLYKIGMRYLRRLLGGRRLESLPLPLAVRGVEVMGAVADIMLMRLVYVK
jgi:hypothetical protein